MKRGVRWALVAALAAACAAGCKGPPPGKEEFNNLLASYNRRLARPARAFRKAVLPMATGQPADAPGARAALDDLKKALKGVRGDVEWLDIPSNSGKNAQPFLDKYKEYLTMEETFPEKYFQPILDVVEERGPTPEDKWAKVKPLLDDLATAEKKYIPSTPGMGGMPGGPGGMPGGSPGGGGGSDSLIAAQNAYCQDNKMQAMTIKQIQEAAKAKK
jgi:hypothetical protein